MRRTIVFAGVLVGILLSSITEARTRESHCALIFELYAHALAHGKAARFVELTEDYADCVLAEALHSPSVSRELLSHLKARRQVDERVRRVGYGGQVAAHPLVVKAGFIVVRALERDASKVYVSSLVRSPEKQRRLLRHPVLRRVAAVRSKHVLGGMAVDVAFLGRRRSMASLGARARRALKKELGAKARALRVVVEPYCLHIELDSKNPLGRQALEKRKRELLRAGILKRARPGVVPAVSDYRTEAQWRSFVRSRS